jgi:hypothetical protein
MNASVTAGLAALMCALWQQCASDVCLKKACVYPDTWPIHFLQALKKISRCRHSFCFRQGGASAHLRLIAMEISDKFAAQYIVLGTIWEALSPDPCLSSYETDYRWLM